MNQFQNAHPTRHLPEGHLVGRYQIISVAGAGGMGVVYAARQSSLGRVVALKVIRPEIARVAEYRERFEREARLAASVTHPHVVSIYDVGESDDQLFLAMQWIDGDDLRGVLDHTGPLAPARAVQVTTQIAGALHAVHSVAGLVHRDIKPANVMMGQVGGHDHAYLSDFGVARPSDKSDQLTQTGWVVGTIGYLSPEQIRGSEPSSRSDLYALGCMFFETITGRQPFSAENDMALRWAHANDRRPTASSVLPALGRRYDDFFATALAVNPDERFASGNEFATALVAAHTDEDVTGKIFSARTPTAVGPSILVRPPLDGTPQAPASLNPAYEYAAPPPANPPKSGSGRPLTLILLGIVALTGIVVGVLAAGGIFSHTTATSATLASTARAATRSAVAATASTPARATSHKPPPTSTRIARATANRTAVSPARTQVRPIAHRRVGVGAAASGATTAQGSSSTSTLASPVSATSATFSEMTPPSDAYSILLPSNWTDESEGASTDVWVGPDPNERLQVITSSCAACVSDGNSPNLSDVGVPQGTFSTTKLNPDALAYEANAGGDPYPDNGVDVVTRQGSNITGYAEADLWLPSSDHVEATKILDSFSLLKATNP
jgi:serine/threonine protein kinase